MIPEAAAFDKSQLKHTETAEKVVLPDKKEWSEVKEMKAAHLSSIHRGVSLDKHVEVEEKGALPTAEEFAHDQEPKKIYKDIVPEAAAFDKSQLKHTETTVKNTPVVG